VLRALALIVLLLAPFAAAQDDTSGASAIAQGKESEPRRKKKRRHKREPKVIVVPAPIWPAPIAPLRHHSKNGRRVDEDEDSQFEKEDEEEEKPKPKPKSKETGDQPHERLPGEAVDFGSEGGKEGGKEGGNEGGSEGSGEEGATAECAEGEECPEQEKTSPFELQGYLRARATHAVLDSHALLQGVTQNVPENFAVFEPNIQPKLRLFDNHITLAADISILFQSADPYATLLVNDLYVQGSILDSIYIVAGKRRVVWGTGLSWNPTDLINPQRDLLEPARTRAGSLMLPMVDVALEQVTFSAYLTPPITYDKYGAPTKVQSPFFGTRVFTNQFETDMSLMYFYDSVKMRHSIGTAASRIFFDNYEAHFEGILHFGPVDRPASPDSDQCGPPVGPVPNFGGAAVLGARRDWSDHSLLSVELLYSSAGYGPEEYALLRTELPCLRAGTHINQLKDPSSAPPVSQQVVLVRQMYASVLAQYPHIMSEGFLEHFGVSGGLIVSFADGSFMTQGRIDATLEPVTFSLIGVWLFGFNGGEFTLTPTKGLVSLDVQWSY
jgi:hypothetical protein